MKFIFCMNIIPDNMAGLLRGAIKSLAIQDKILMPHIICQGFLSNIFTYVFGFYFFPGDMVGIWIAKTLVSFCLLAYYVYVLVDTDWEEMTKKASER